MWINCKMLLKITFLITVDISEPPADGISLKEKKTNIIRDRENTIEETVKQFTSYYWQRHWLHIATHQFCLNTSLTLINLISHKISEIAKQQYFWFPERVQEQILMPSFAIALLYCSTTSNPNLCLSALPPVSGSSSGLNTFNGIGSFLPSLLEIQS